MRMDRVSRPHREAIKILQLVASKIYHTEEPMLLKKGEERNSPNVCIE